MPPPASGLPARLVLGPALRAQSDGRLVRLVREGYESAFEEIVRRYRRPLDRFAAGMVGGRSEDVTQDSFRKALEALRRGDAEVELRPWLYRIVRNTALNDLRDRPPAAAELVDDLVGGGRSAAAEAEERAEVAALTARLRALPEKQRAALVMRELEGMSHEEIADALGVSGGAARQAIARGRAAVRSSFGAFVPLPLPRALASGGDGAAEVAGGAAAGGVGAAIGGSAAVGGSAAAFGGGLGAAGALKVGLATVFVAGSIGAGIAIDHHGIAHHHPEAAKTAASAPGGTSGAEVRATPSPVLAEVDDRHGASGEDGPHRRGDDGRSGHGHDDDGHGGRGSGDDQGDHGGPGSSGESGESGSSGQGDGSGDDARSGSSGSDDGGGHHRGGRSGDGSGHGGSGDDDNDAGNSGPGRGSGDSGSGRGSGDSGSRHDGGSGHSSGGSRAGGGSRHSSDGSGSGGGSRHGSAGSGSGDSGSSSGSSGSTRGGHGSDDATESVVETETAATSSAGGSESSSGSDDSGSSGGSDSSGGDSSSTSGSSGGPSPTLDLSDGVGSGSHDS
jgi:RNA polymerase sigma factor (sigma-70 family)